MEAFSLRQIDPRLGRLKFDIFRIRRLKRKSGDQNREDRSTQHLSSSLNKTQSEDLDHLHHSSSLREANKRKLFVHENEGPPS
jgi:hypothetical protein